jgi:prepilin-type processing-associated H-X9-DG protein
MPMFNKNLGAWFPGTQGPGNLASMNAPSSLVLAAHGLGTRPSVGGDDVTTGCLGQESGVPGGAPPAQGSTQVYCAARFKHNGGSVYLLADGHAKWFRGPASWVLQGTQIAYRKSLSPNAAAWFRED